MGSAASAGAGSRVEVLHMESVSACSGAARLEDNTQEDTLTFLFQGDDYDDDEAEQNERIEEDSDNESSIGEETYFDNSIIDALIDELYSEKIEVIETCPD